MIDGYIILNLPVNIDELLNNDLLLFPQKVNERDGEILNKPRIAVYKGQTFIYTKKEIEKNEIKKIIENVKLKGSLHKYHNNGEHNYNDFYFTDLKNVIFDLCYKFNINPVQSDFNNLEFGVNIYIPIEPELLFKYIINHKGKPFQKFNILGAKSIECIHSNFIIKIYDKGHQYNKSGNLLRIEIKVIRMQFFKDNKVNIKTISDLLNITELFKLKPILTTVFNEILIYDYSINESILNAKECLILSNGNNPKYWETLLPDSKDFINGNKNPEYNQNRKKYYRELYNFKELIKKHSTSTLQKDISNLIEKKCNELINIDNEKRDKLTDISEEVQNTEKGQINISSIVRICPVTELDISMQKPGSKFLCIAGIRYFYEKEKEIYYQLEKRLSAKWRHGTLETQFREIAHSIRNEFFNPNNNPRNNLRNRIKKIEKYPALFNTDNYLMLSSAQKQILNSPNSIYGN